ncbi:hypothetical protein FRC00_004717, partial [Tulasnella sp. 408]
MAPTVSDTDETCSATLTEVEPSLNYRETFDGAKDDVADKVDDVDVEKMANAVDSTESDVPPDGGLA